MSVTWFPAEKPLCWMDVTRKPAWEIIRRWIDIKITRMASGATIMVATIQKYRRFLTPVTNLTLFHNL